MIENLKMEKGKKKTEKWRKHVFPVDELTVPW